MTQNTTPQTSQPQAQPASSPGGSKPYCRKLKPRAPKRAGQARKRRPTARGPSEAPAHMATKKPARPPNVPRSIAADVPSGHVVSMTYGPPSAQNPPMSMTARWPKKRSVMPAARPATPRR